MSFTNVGGTLSRYAFGGRAHFVGTTFYTTSTSANVRTGFTIAFAVLTALTALIGALYLKRRNQRQLLRDERRTIALNHLASWMTVTEIARYWWKTRKLPAGGYAWIMLAVGAFELTSHIFVSRFILADFLPDFCEYTSGIYDTSITIPTYPQSQLAPANIAISAQIYNTAKGGLNGVYQIAVQNETFYVGQNDQTFFGAWNCTTQPGNQTYPQSTNQSTIFDDLVKKGVLFSTNTGYIYEYHYLSNLSTEGIFMWTASEEADVRKPWDVKAAYSTLVTQGDTTTMTGYTCHLDAADRVVNTLSLMQSYDTLKEWCERTYGLISLALFNDGTDAATAVPDTLGRALNAATMVAAAGNNLLPNTDEVTSYSCIRPYTAVSAEIIIALVIVFLIFWFFVLGEIFLVCVTMRKKKKTLVDDCPGDLASWQTAMLNDLFLDDAELGATGDRKIKPHQIANYSFGWVKGTDGHDRTGYKKAGSDDVSVFSSFSFVWARKSGDA